MHHSDTGPGYYQYYQSQFHNPNPNPNPTDPQPNSFAPPPPAAPPTFASAPPVTSTHNSSDYSSYYPSSNSSSSYPPYPQPTDQTLNPQTLTYPPNPNVQSSNPSPQPYNFPHLNPPPYYGYDQNQPSLGYDHLNPSYNSNPNPGLSANAYAPATNYGGGGGGYESGSNYGAYGDVGKPRTEVGAGYDEYGGYQDEGVYQYSGGKVEPYGARGTGTKSSDSSSSGVIFDDYGRPIGFGNEKKQNGSGSGSTGRIVKAVPKAETQQDVNSGVQKYRVKVLSEGAGQSDMDVLCQVGLDGIRLLDTATGRTLRIYPLETVTRCEVLDSYIFAFWAKTSVDMDAKRIRLKSNSYTTNNILDTVTAATFQIKEIGVRNDSSNAPKLSEQQSERKKGLADWVNLMKPRNEEKDHWVPDEAVAKCTFCASDFGAFLRRHHCRNCGDIFCDKCTQGRIALTEEEGALPVRVCDRCMAEVTQRLANAKQSVGKGSAIQSHEDLARKLKEEMDKNRKTSAGFASNGSGTRTKDVACPTCTVHLQVQVPTSGSETIECSVCQHPFLVSAH